MNRTAAQERATAENWSIWILLGWLRLMIHLKPVLRRTTYNVLENTIEAAIEEIKTAQKLRIEKRSRK